MIVYDFSPISDFYYSIGEAETDVPWFRPDQLFEQMER